jgi:hypothetical protein
MKKYIHKSGKYAATEKTINLRLSVHDHRTKPVSRYEMLNLQTHDFITVEPCLIEDSSDWTLLPESVETTYTKKEILNAVHRFFRTFLGRAYVEGIPGVIQAGFIEILNEEKSYKANEKVQS